YYISKGLDLNLSGVIKTVKESAFSKAWFFDDWRDSRFFLKQFLSGAFITIVMTGLDQDMMQKNLSCKNIHEAKKNMYWMSFALVPVNLMFMSLGVLLVVFAQKNGIAIPERTDDLFPLIATQANLGPVVAVFFIIGLVAAAYSSADSALTALTTSFTVDILNPQNKSEKELKAIRTKVHIGVSVVLAIVILLFNAINNESVISAIFKVAGYTYGPLLGMYAFGLFTKYKVNDKYVPIVAIVSPIICFVFNHYSQIILGGYQIGFELLILNGLITFMGLFIIRESYKAH
ncbi:MAG: sodium:solute symporter, partial [Bacteroidales bacterium]|nr:sodium:solute symporter [Bacteroidales bacterium]